MKRRSNGPLEDVDGEDEEAEDVDFGTGVQISDDERVEILMRHEIGESARLISREMGLGRDGVSKYSCVRFYYQSAIFLIECYMWDRIIARAAAGTALDAAVGRPRMFSPGLMGATTDKLKGDDRVKASRTSAQIAAVLVSTQKDRV